MDSLDKDFCEFLAKDELIEIVPTFKYEKVLNLINGDFGPFTPAIATTVPLWMAIELHRSQKCRFNFPEWIKELDNLTEEQAKSTGLIKMPSDHWREIVEIFVSLNLMKEPPKELINMRENILKKSVDALLTNVVSLEDDVIAQVRIQNITKYELDYYKKRIAAYLAISKGFGIEAK